MKNYYVIESSSKSDFNRMVTDALNEGYECVGPVSFQQFDTPPRDPTQLPRRYLHFAQGMVKTT